MTRRTAATGIVRTTNAGQPLDWESRPIVGGPKRRPGKGDWRIRDLAFWLGVLFAFWGGVFFAAVL